MWFARLKEKPAGCTDIQHDLLPTLKPQIYYETEKMVIATNGNVPPVRREIGVRTTRDAATLFGHVTLEVLPRILGGCVT
jgi:hypothetical protein